MDLFGQVCLDLFGFVWICAIRFVWICAIRFVWIYVIRFVLHRLQERFRLCLHTPQATIRPPACRGCWSPPRSWCLARRTWAGWSGPSSTLLLQRRWQLQYDHRYINVDKMMFSHVFLQCRSSPLSDEWWWQDEFLTCLQCSHRWLCTALSLPPEWWLWWLYSMTTMMMTIIMFHGDHC